MKNTHRLRWLLLLACALLLPGMSLAPATLAYAPDQAVRGAAIFNDRCSTCHGDVGQGLTDEFRSTWAEGDRNCWIPACHGSNPPKPGGFTLPRVVPALVGPGTLTKFNNAQALQAFIKAAMPMQEPGVLTDQEYWAATAFLLRENGVQADGKILEASTAAGIAVPRSGQPVPRTNRTPTARQAMPARERAPIIVPTPMPPERQDVPLAPLASRSTDAPSPANPATRPVAAANPTIWTLLLILVLGVMTFWRGRRKAGG